MSLLSVQPKTLREALKLNELETLLSLATRPPHTGGLASVASDPSLVMQYGALPLDVCDDTTVPAAAPHPRLDARVTTLSQAIAKTSKDQEKKEQEEVRLRHVGRCLCRGPDEGFARCVTLVLVPDPCWLAACVRLSDDVLRQGRRGARPRGAHPERRLQAGEGKPSVPWG
jgi:hypothetical protein